MLAGFQILPLGYGSTTSISLCAFLSNQYSMMLQFFVCLFFSEPFYCSCHLILPFVIHWLLCVWIMLLFPLILKSSSFIGLLHISWLYSYTHFTWLYPDCNSQHQTLAGPYANVCWFTYPYITLLSLWFTLPFLSTFSLVNPHKYSTNKMTFSICPCHTF